MSNILLISRNAAQAGQLRAGLFVQERERASAGGSQNIGTQVWGRNVPLTRRNVTSRTVCRFVRRAPFLKMQTVACVGDGDNVSAAVCDGRPSVTSITVSRQNKCKMRLL